MKKSDVSRILFLNQSAGPLFRELAEDISRRWPVGELFTGHRDTLHTEHNECLRIVASPEYDRTGGSARRLWSWLKYLILAFVRCVKTNRHTLLFLVYPPFLEIIAYFLKKLRGQRYVILVYDIYPDTFVNFGPLKANGWVAGVWRWIYRKTWADAEVVFTIGEKMARKVETMFDSSRTTAGRVVVIPNWANSDWIKPLEKSSNDFARTHGQTEKLTVMYSGNLGQTHDIGTILRAAKALNGDDSIGFMIIGEGAKRGAVEQAKRDDDLSNTIVLGFQPESVLPYSLTTGDIAVVTLDAGSEGLSVPSKTYYAMAAGAAIIALCDGECEIAQMVRNHNCGVVVSPGDEEAMVRAIQQLSVDKERLSLYRKNSRVAAEKFYSRRNTQQYIDAMAECLR